MSEPPVRSPVRIPVRIVATSMPRDYCRDAGIEHLGIWCRKEVVDRVPTTAAGATFDLTVDVVPRDDGFDYRGPYVKAGRGQRHLALYWGREGTDGWETVRGVKLRLFELADDLVESALEAGGLRAELDLTDPRGTPVTATVREPLLRWSPARTG